MRKQISFLFIVMLCCITSQAQFRYTFKDTTTPYVSLPTNAVKANGAAPWAYDNYKIQMPFSWTFDSAYQTSMVRVYPNDMGLFIEQVGTSSNFVANGFIFGFADYMDRGPGNGSSQSPIRYLTTGVTPNRIFKIEIANAGFIKERMNHGTANDFVNVQFWIYEGSSVVEAHYGPSGLTYFAENYDFGQESAVLITLVQQVESNPDKGTYYHLSGNVASLQVKAGAAPLNSPQLIDFWPVEGTVYRFTPKFGPAGIANSITLGNIKVYPNPVSTSLFVEAVSTGTKATLYSMVGQPVLQTILTGSQTLDIAALPAGVYKLVLTDKAGVSGATTVVKE